MTDEPFGGYLNDRHAQIGAVLGLAPELLFTLSLLSCGVEYGIDPTRVFTPEGQLWVAELARRGLTEPHPAGDGRIRPTAPVQALHLERP